jgi:cell division protein FtsW
MNRRLDPTLVITLLLLITGGLLMIYSASAPHLTGGNDLKYLQKQMFALLLGLLLCWGTALTPTRYFRAYNSKLVLIVCILLFLCFTGFGVNVNGATRWIDIGITNIQPSALAKVVSMVAIAANLHRFRTRINEFRYMMLSLYPAFIFVGLIIFEPDFGSSAIILMGAGIMLFIAGVKYRYFIWGGVAVGVLGIPIMLWETYRLRRILAYMAPWDNQSGDAYQIIQGWLAFHNGGLFGQGLGNGLAKRHFLPEPWTDYIGAVLAEETGFLGFTILIGLYLLVLWRGLRIAKNAKDAFSTYLASALTFMICGEAFLNLGVITGILPPKGLVLPFISYGSTSIICHLWAIGFLLSIAAESQENNQQGWVKPESIQLPVGS